LSLFVTTTSAAPALWLAVVQVILVAFDVDIGQSLPPTVTEGEEKSSPEMVSVVPPSGLPEEGEILVMEGAAL